MHKFLFYHKIYYMPLHVSSTMCSKRVQTHNKSYYKTRICALSWLITKIILRCTISKTSKHCQLYTMPFQKLSLKMAP